MHTAVARVLTSISEPGDVGPLKAIPMLRLIAGDRVSSGGQRLQSKLEFVLAPDQTVPLSVAPVKLIQGAIEETDEGGVKEIRKHT